MRRCALVVALVFLAGGARANEIDVDKRTLQLDDTITITVVLEGSFAGVDTVRIPLQNLVLEGEPSVSSEFRWINGESSRRKVLRYLARPLSPGNAVIGPLTLNSSDGQVERLAPIPIQVLPDATAGSTDPAQIMRELIATNRDPIFIVAEADKSEVYEGEETVVTWTLYNGATVQQYSLGNIPKLENFWAEELDTRSEQPQQVVLGGVTAQKLTIRRAALFPIRSGRLVVPSMAVNASLMKRVSTGDPFGIFEGVLVDVHRRSAPIAIVAKPIPAGAPVAAVGNINIQCRPVTQKKGGPVTFDVLLSGRANLRAMQPLSWKSTVDGSAQVIDRGVRVYPVAYDAWMTRTWRYVIFPAHAGTFVVPPLAATILTAEGERREVGCEARTLQVSVAETDESQPEAAAPQLRQRRRFFPLIGTIAAVVLLLAAAIPRIRNRWRLRKSVQALLRDTPAETRVAVEAAMVANGLDPLALLHEPSDRGDAWRAFRSLVDAAEKDRIETTSREIGHRVRDVVVAFGLTVQSRDDHDGTPDAAPLHGG
jgi:hypothetical protein